jgi:hypothetical protein
MEKVARHFASSEPTANWLRYGNVHPTAHLQCWGNAVGPPRNYPAFSGTAISSFASLSQLVGEENSLEREHVLQDRLKSVPHFHR